MKIYDFEQRSDEWHKIRLGKFTGTDFATVANGKSDTIKRLVYKKAAEIITGKKSDTEYINPNMERGVELEAEAKEAFMLETGLTIKNVGFIEYNDYIGYSPDGLIGDDSGIELKCKDNHTHLECLLYGDNSYKWQIQGGMFVSGRKYWYFCSYNKEFPINTRLYKIRYEPDGECFAKLDEGIAKITKMLTEVLNEYNKFK